MNTHEMIVGYNEGKSIEKIAQESGMSYSGVRSRLRRNGVTMRSHSAHLPRGIKEGDTECKNGHELPNPIKRNQNGLYCQACRTKTQANRRKALGDVPSD